MTKQEQTFVATVWRYYKAHGRHQLPWRQTTDPYRILVSEVMLQQTQVDRVVPKYEAFMAAYPTVPKLADAQLRAVLERWQGLGYNRRALYLQQAAHYIANDLHNVFPTTYAGLLALPGVGPYTAGAIMAFAYNQPVPLIETNIRTVYLYHFFTKQTAVTDTEILKRITSTMDETNPRQWYAALMDYGAHLKRTTGNHKQRAAQYKQQSTFTDSDRQIRGAIIRVLLTATKSQTEQQLAQQLSTYTPTRIAAQLAALKKDGLVAEWGSRYTLPT